MPMTRSTLLLAAAFCSFVATGAHAETIKIHAAMDTASEVPPKTTAGKGTVEGTIDTATKALTYTLTYSGLTGAATAAHFHGPAEAGANAGVLVPIAPPLTSPVKGTATLTDAQIADFKAGKVYANVHTAANPGGEIRGQVK
jgi:hypothetical protein